MLCYIGKNKIDKNEDDFLDWYYSMWRVIENTRNDIDEDDVVKFYKMIKEMIKYTTGKKSGYTVNIADENIELEKLFGSDMLEEEREKAQLLQTNIELDKLFDKAHKHKFFKGKIGFLIKLCKEDNKFNITKFKRMYKKVSEQFSNYDENKNRIYIDMLKQYQYYWQSNNYINFGILSNNTKDRLQWYKKVFEDEKFRENYFKETAARKRKFEWWERILIKYKEIFNEMERKKIYIDENKNTAYIVQKSNHSQHDCNLYTYGFYLFCKKNNMTSGEYSGQYNSGESLRFSFIYDDKKYDVRDKNGKIQIYYYGKTKKVTKKQEAVCKEFMAEDYNDSNIDKHYSNIIEHIPKRITL